MLRRLPSSKIMVWGRRGHRSTRHTSTKTLFRRNVKLIQRAHHSQNWRRVLRTLCKLELSNILLENMGGVRNQTKSVIAWSQAPMDHSEWLEHFRAAVNGHSLFHSLRALSVAPLLQVPRGTAVVASVLMHVRQCMHMRTMMPHTIYICTDDKPFPKQFPEMFKTVSNQFQTPFKTVPAPVEDTFKSCS